MPGTIKFFRKRRAFQQLLETVGDLWAASNSLLMHFDNNFNDEMGHIVANNGVLFSSTSKFGGYSAHFNGSGYLVLPSAADWQFGTKNFTIEGWVYFSSVSSNQALVTQLTTANDASWNLDWNTNGSLRLTTSTGSYDKSWSWVPSTGQWYHLAVSKASGVIRAFINGTQIGSALVDTNSWGTSNALYIGKEVARNNDSPFTGYIDELRITNGLGRYLTNFTVPTEAFPNPAPIDLYFDYNTVLCHFDNDFTDVMGHTVTNVGGTTFSSQSRFGSACATFSGTQYLAIAGSDVAPGTSPFTIEGWFYLTDHTDRTLFGSPTGFSVLANGGSGGRRVYHGGSMVINDAAGSFPLNQWIHVALTRDSSNALRLFQNGILVASTTGATQNATTDVRIGSGVFNNLQGRADEFRVTVGIARYTTNFTPPGQAHPTQTFEVAEYDPYFETVRALLPLSDTANLIGNSTSTTVGPVAFSSSNRKFNDTVQLASSVSCIDIDFNAPIKLSNTDWTIEAWIYPDGPQPIYATVFGMSNARTYYGSSTKIDITVSGSALRVAVWEGSYYVNSGNISTYPVPLNTWSHVAFVRSNNLFTVYLNGVNVYNTTSSVSLTGTINTATIGQLYDTLMYRNSNYQFKGNISNVRVSQAARYTQNFKPIQLPFPDKGLSTNNTAYDPYAKQTVLAMHMDDLSDYTGNQVSIVGSPLLDSSIKKFGTSSFYFRGDNWISVYDSLAPNQGLLGSQDFTAECWVYPTSFSEENPIFAQYSYTQSTRTILSLYGGKLKVFNGSTGAVTGTTTLVLNTWYHVAFVRVGNKCYAYLNGNLETVHTNFQAPYQTNTALGYYFDGTYNRYFLGYIDDVRITRVARYLSNFTPSNQPFVNPVVADPTTALLHLNDATDVRGNSVTNSNVTFDTTNKKFGTASGLFNRASQSKLTLPRQIQSNDFTVDAWVRPVSVNSVIFSQGTFGTSGRFRMMIDSSGYLNFQLGSSNTTSTAIIPLNQWSHVAITRSGTTVTMYVNGTPVLTDTRSDAVQDTNFVIGADWNGGTEFNGNIDEFRIVDGKSMYSGNFTPATVAYDLTTATEYNARYATDPYKDQTVLHLGFDGVGVADSTGRSLVSFYGSPQSISSHGVSSGSISNTVTGCPYADIGNTHAGPFTIECWARLLETTNGKRIFETTYYPDTHRGLALIVTGPSSVMWYASSDGGTNYVFYRTVTAPVPITLWTHYAITFDGSVYKLYVNGVMVDSFTSSTVVAPTANKMYVGMYSSGNNTAGYFDNVRVTKAVRYLSNFIPSATY